MAISTIEEIGAAKKRVQMLVVALRQAPLTTPTRLADELKKTTDEYARAVRELNSR